MEQKNCLAIKTIKYLKPTKIRNISKSLMVMAMDLIKVLLVYTHSKVWNHNLEALGKLKKQ